jgi:hypothetical protein
MTAIEDGRTDQPALEFDTQRISPPDEAAAAAVDDRGLARIVPPYPPILNADATGASPCARLDAKAGADRFVGAGD